MVASALPFPEAFGSWFQQLAFGLEPVIAIMTIGKSRSRKKFVSAFGDAVRPFRLAVAAGTAHLKNPFLLCLIISEYRRALGPGRRC